MVHEIAFPALGLDFNISRVAFTVLGKHIYWYGIIICAGFVLGALYLNARTKEFGFTTDHLIDCMLLCVPVGILCARAYYVIFEWDYYSQHLNEIIAIWNGGIAIYGSVIGIVLALWGYSRYKKVSFFGLCDMAALGLLIGQAIGRWGNFVNAEAHGGPTGLPWGMSIDGGAPVHPTFLYESLWNAVGFAALHFYSKKRKFQGEVALLYVAWYGLGRFWIEGLRTDSLYVFTALRVSQVLAAVSCIAAVCLLARQYQKIKVEKAFYVPSAAPAEGPAAAGQPAMEQPGQPAAEQPAPAPENETVPQPEGAPSPAAQPEPNLTPEEETK